MFADACDRPPPFQTRPLYFVRTFRDQSRDFIYVKPRVALGFHKMGVRFFRFSGYVFV